MSDLGELAYMGTNEDFDLPRWQSQSHLEPLSSSAQAAHSANAQSSYLYSAPPPPSAPAGPSPATRVPQSQQAAASSRQQARISQLLDENHALASQPPYGQSTQLGRSASFSTAAGRARRHHQPDDLEGAFASDNQATLRQNSLGGASQRSNPYYPPAVAYHQSTPSPNPGPSPAGDMYYNGASSDLASKQRTHNAPDSSQSLRSPLRTTTSTTQTTLLDPYSQQFQYSPSTTAYSYNAPSGASYPTHNRSNSQQAKNEPLTPPHSYSPMQTQSTNNAYSTPTYTTEAAPQHHAGSQSQPHLTARPLQRHGSTSTPSTPSYAHSANSHSTQTSTTNTTPLSYSHSAQTSSSQYYPQDQPMGVDASPPRQRRVSGFIRVRDATDLRPYVNPQPPGRRMDSSGVYLSPLRQLTTNILETYHICNPSFRYESALNPRRVLTKPSKPAHNEGYDNDDYDYILYVNDWLGAEDGHKYLILDILGQGTFGQVVKCQNMKTHEIVAVKVVKNKPAYFNQSMMEVTILDMLNKTHDPNDEHHILRLRDSFIHRSHLCLVFELLSSNLYELIKQNQFQGLSTQLVKVFTAQLLDALTVLKEARLIHCDLKPENILLKSLQSPQIKVIDFGSACHEQQTVYTYIQSRFYRSPEVLLGIPYTAAIDMWSLGCIAVELFLGLPLFPGTSEYNQITRITEMLGMPPQYMMDMGKQTSQFFDSYVDVYGHKKYRLKSIEQYSREHNTNEQPGKQYFKANSLPDIINTAPLPTFKSSSRQGQELEKELNNRASFIDFCQGLLNLNPIERWSPQQARMHPFITGEKFAAPFTPIGASSQQTPSPASATTQESRRPYGGLVPSQPRGTRAYQDAATYNHHLAQHQAYTAQAQAASQAANNSFRNPYLQQQQQQPNAPAQPPPPSSYAAPPQEAANASFGQQAHQSQHPSQQVQGGQRQVAHQNSAAPLSAGQGSGRSLPPSLSMNPNPPSNSYYPGNRGRANTINQMDAIPPALARLQHMNQDVIAGRNALTPVLNRDDAIREWERRQAGKPREAQPYPQLEYLQQQAEMVGTSGFTGWQQPNQTARYPPPSKLAQSYHPQTIIVDEDRRDAVMSNVRSAARGDAGGTLYGSAAPITAPAQAYTGSGPASAGTRYTTSYTTQQPSSSSFDQLDQRTDVGAIYAPIQPNQHQAYNRDTSAQSSQQPSHGAAPNSRHGPPPAQNLPASFYPGSVVAPCLPGTTQPGGLFSGNEQRQGQKDLRRGTSMDVWPR